jgi:uncharacterized protein YjbJ (UPF0337 family)
MTNERVVGLDEGRCFGGSGFHSRLRFGCVISRTHRKAGCAASTGLKDGTAKNVEGKAQEGVGRAAGDTNAAIQGKVKQAVGSAQDIYGQAKDSAGDALNAVKDASASVEDSISTYIETNPYTTIAIALGLGWLIGRTHRPF